MANKKKDDLDPQVVKRWITILIAVLSAIAGAIGEASTHVMAAAAAESYLLGCPVCRTKNALD